MEKVVVEEIKETTNVSRLQFKKFRPLLKTQYSSKITLVLDLDHTLIFASLTVSFWNIKELKEKKDSIKVVIPLQDKIEEVYVVKRPKVEEFLLLMSEWFELVLFTASNESYATKVLQLLPDVFYEKLFRQHCDETNQNGKTIYKKDLEKLGRDLSKVVLVDDFKDSVYQKQIGNLILIKGFHGEEEDQDLMNLKDFLCNLKDEKEIYTLVQKFKTL